MNVADDDFPVNSMVFYPEHGPTRIVDRRTMTVMGQAQQWHVLLLLDIGAKILIPVGKEKEAGVRTLIGRREAHKLINSFALPALPHDLNSLRDCYRDFQAKLKNGSAQELAAIIRDLQNINGKSRLRFAERRILDKARRMLIDELAAATERPPEEIRGIIESQSGTGRLKSARAS